MNESELKLYCLEHAGEQLSAEAEALLKRDPGFKRQVDRLITVRNLISLKRHEYPSEASMERCMRGIREQIAMQPPGLWSQIRSWFSFEQPALAYGFAAVALAMAGAFVVLNQGAVDGPSVASESVTLPEIADLEPVDITADVQELPIEQTFAAFDKPLIVLRSDSTNVQPSTPRMSIGGGEVVPVSFEY